MFLICWGEVSRLTGFLEASLLCKGLRSVPQTVFYGSISHPFFTHLLTLLIPTSCQCSWSAAHPPHLCMSSVKI